MTDLARRTGSWTQRYRQQWIAETLYVFGYINRHHICRKFDITEAQASIDLQHFQGQHKGLIEYDRSAKRYVLTRRIERERVL